MSELEPDAPTELLPRARAAEPEPAPTPVFVDVSGRRRRLARRIAMGVFPVAGVYVLMVVWSLFGGPVAPDGLMPFSAPPPVAPTGRPAPAASQTARVVVGVRSTSSASGGRAAAVSPTNASTPTAKSSATAPPSASPSATATKHRQGNTPGKPTASPTNGHGH